MPKKIKEKIATATKYIKQKKNIVKISKERPLNTIKFDEDYFEIMRNEWLLDKYIAKNGVYDNEAEENTLTAFENAVSTKRPTTITVQSLSDGNIICYKDKTLARAGGNSYVANSTIKDIEDLIIHGTEQHIATLEQALNVIDNKVPVIIDILNDTTLHKTEENVLAIVDKYMHEHNINEGVAIMSINPFTLEYFHSNAPWLPRILRSGKFKVKKYAGIKARTLRKLKYHNIAGADYVAYNAKDLPYGGIKKVQPVGVLAYNVTSQEQYRKVAKYCDNIIFEGFEPSI